MGPTLSVLIRNREMLLGEFIESCASALGKLLRSPGPFPVEIVGVDKGVRWTDLGMHLSDRWIYEIETKLPTRVYCTMNLSLDDWTNPRDFVAMISAVRPYTAPWLVVAAAAALSLAHLADGEISDYEREWTDREISTPQEFLEVVRKRFSESI